MSSLIFIFFCLTRIGRPSSVAPGVGMLILYSFEIGEDLLDQEAVRLLKLDHPRSSSARRRTPARSARPARRKSCRSTAVSMARSE